jgi:hypothetical protein
MISDEETHSSGVYFKECNSCSTAVSSDTFRGFMYYINYHQPAYHRFKKIKIKGGEYYCSNGCFRGCIVNTLADPTWLISTQYGSGPLAKNSQAYYPPLFLTAPGLTSSRYEDFNPVSVLASRMLVQRRLP